jgi:hypothetical protein
MLGFAAGVNSIGPEIVREAAEDAGLVQNAAALYPPVPPSGPAPALSPYQQQ